MIMATSLTMLAWASVQQSAGYWLTMLLDVSLKGLVILGVAGAVTLVMRKSSATARHLVWLLAIASLLVLPVLSVALPGWAVLPQWIDLESKEALTQGEAAPAQTMSKKPAGETTSPIVPSEDFQGPPIAGEVALQETATPTETSAPPVSVANEPATKDLEVRFSAVSVLPWVMLGWAVGVVICLTPLVLGRLSLWRLKRSARPIKTGPLAELLAKTSGQLGLKRPVTLLSSEHRPMPMIWGIFRSKLLLPSEADEWSLQRQRVVLLHELAHAARWDCLAKFVAHIACALYWFNPLVWIAFKQMQIEAESACDDLVLNAGAEPSKYAEHILEIASGLQAHLLAAHSSIAMARKSKLEGRLLAILDGKRNRRRLTFFGILVAVLILVGLVVPMSVLKARNNGGEQIDNQPKPAVQPAEVKYVATLSNGTSVELLGVTEIPIDTQAWWRPDGSPLNFSPFDRVDMNPADDPNFKGFKYYTTALRLKGRSLAEVEICPSWRFEGAVHGGTAGAFVGDRRLESKKDGMLAGGAKLSQDVSSTKIGIGIAVGDWCTAITYNIYGFHKDNGISIRIGEPVRMPFERLAHGQHTVGVTHNVNRFEAQIRLVALDKQGKLHISPSSGSVGTDNLRQTNATFPDISSEQVKEYQFQIRRYEWIEFKNVSLVPGNKTNVQVVVETKQKPAAQAGVEVNPNPKTPDGVSKALNPTSKSAKKTTYKGVVKNVDGEPIEGVVVRSDLSFYRSGEFKSGEATASTDSTGHFEIGPLPKIERKKGSRQLVFEHPKYAIGWFKPLWSKNVAPDAIEVTLFLPSVLTGRVLDKNGKPVAGAAVEASLQLRYNYFSRTSSNGMAALTNPDGKFAISRIPEPARLHVKVTKKGYVRYSSREGYRSDNYPIRTSENLRIVLEPGGTIKGQLTLNGKVYKKKGIRIAAMGRKSPYIAFTDEKGAFEIIGLSGGSYVISADNNALDADELFYSPKSFIVVTKGETTVDLALSKGLPVTLQVVDADSGKGVPEIWVGVTLPSIGLKLPSNKRITVFKATSDSAGRCLVRLSPGRYKVRARGWKNGQSHFFSKIIEIPSDGRNLTFKISITPRPVILGQLVDGKGNPVVGEVRITRDPILTDDKGQFSIPEPWGSTMEQHIGYAFDTNKTVGRSFVWEKTEDAKPLRLVLEPFATIAGQVIDQDGKGVKNAKVQISIPLGDYAIRPGNPVWKTIIEAGGQFKFEGVPIGLPMTIVASKPGYVGQVKFEKLTAGQVFDTSRIVLKPRPGFGDGAVEWTGTLSGKVINEKGKPMTRMRVYARRGGGIVQDTTDSRGRYKLTGLPKGEEISMGVYASGYGHCSFKVTPGKSDFDMQIFPQGYDLYGKQAPGLFVGKWLNTKPITLKQFRGKVVLLQIGIRLPDYPRQLEQVQEVLEKYGDKGLEVIAVHQRLHVTRPRTGQATTQEKLLAFIKENDIKFPFGIDGDSNMLFTLPATRSPNGAMYSVYGVKATPALYLIDKQGKVRISPTRMNLDEWIEKLLAE